MVLMRQGRYSEAEPLLAEAVRIWRQVRGPGEPDSFREAIFESSLASLYQGQRRYAEAEIIFVAALGTIRRVMGPENGHTVDAMRDLALLWYATGQLEESETLLRNALEVGRKVLGPRHFDTLQTAYGLALVETSRGRLEEAENLQIEASALSSARFSAPSTPTRSSRRAIWAGIRGKQGRLAEGRELLASTLEAGRADLRCVASARGGIGLRTGLPGRAEQLRPDEALEHLRQAFRSGHLDPNRVLREPDLRVFPGNRSSRGSSRRPKRSRPSSSALPARPVAPIRDGLRLP